MSGGVLSGGNPIHLCHLTHLPPHNGTLWTIYLSYSSKNRATETSKPKPNPTQTLNMSTWRGGECIHSVPTGSRAGAKPPSKPRCRHGHPVFPYSPTHVLGILPLATPWINMICLKLCHLNSLTAYQITFYSDSHAMSDVVIMSCDVTWLCHNRYSRVLPGLILFFLEELHQIMASL